jgi:hypothetical protein
VDIAVLKLADSDHQEQRTPMRGPRRHARVGAATAEENHALVSLADPFTLESRARREVGGLRDLVEQVRQVG